MNIEFDYQIYKLSSTFYKEYTSQNYPEILNKGNRPYNCLLLQTKYDYFICIPFRTNIRHKEAFFFTKSKRSKKSKSGLDYSKCVILGKNTYLQFLEDNAVVDKDEFFETVENIDIIAEKINKYIDEYIKYITYVNKTENEVLLAKYRYSTLQYFHKELGI